MGIMSSTFFNMIFKYDDAEFPLISDALEGDPVGRQKRNFKVLRKHDKLYISISVE